MTRLRPAPHSGSIDVTPIAASASPILAVEIAEAAPASEIDGSTASSRIDTGIAIEAPAAQADTVIAEHPCAGPADADVGDHPLPETPADVPAMVVKDAESSSPESALNAPAVVTDDRPVELPQNVEHAVSEEAPVVPAAVEIEPVDASEPAIVCSPDLELHVDMEPAIADDSPVTAAGSEAPAEDAAETSIDSVACPSVATETEPPLAGDATPVTTITFEDSSREMPSVVTDVAAEPALEAQVADTRVARKLRAKVAEPADRAALIRQRWAETGIRMWNPRLHGSGEAALNIQGSIGLLPPASGETMPRYDKLEFRMLGGQIVCEGVIVEGPAQASHRSFTRLAESGKPERVRESARERQAALA